MYSRKERTSPLGLHRDYTISGALIPPEIVDLNDDQVDKWPSTPAGEQHRVEEVVLHYKTLMAHPTVHAITGGISNTDDSWLSVPTGVLRRDPSPKPAYKGLYRLIKSASTLMTTEAQGQFTCTGFLNAYELNIATEKLSFSLNSLNEHGPVALPIKA